MEARCRQPAGCLHVCFAPIITSGPIGPIPLIHNESNVSVEGNSHQLQKICLPKRAGCVPALETQQNRWVFPTSSSSAWPWGCPAVIHLATSSEEGLAKIWSQKETKLVEGRGEKHLISRYFIEFHCSRCQS